MNDQDDITALQIEPEYDVQSYEDYPYPKDDFLRENYDQIEHLLAAQQEKTRELHLSQTTLEELISTELHDDLCLEIHRRIDED